jgi:hypothetical protein
MAGPFCEGVLIRAALAEPQEVELPQSVSNEVPKVSFAASVRRWPMSTYGLHFHQTRHAEQILVFPFPLPVVRYAEPTRMPCGSNALSTLNVK